MAFWFSFVVALLIAELLARQSIDSDQPAFGRAVTQGQPDPVVLPSRTCTTIRSRRLSPAVSLVSRGGSADGAVRFVSALAWSKVIFCSMKGSLFYTLMIFFLMGFASTRKTTMENKFDGRSVR